MGKRSNAFARRAQDFYPTPLAGVLPLLNHLMVGTKFYEPCAGAGDLIDHLQQFGHVCVGASDIADHGEHPQVQPGIDCLHLLGVDADMFITNPPWSREILHDMILHLSQIRPTWLLIDAGWMHTKQSIPFMDYCLKIVSIGRVKWIEGSKHTGKDDCVWMHFDHYYRRLQHPIMFRARS